MTPTSDDATGRFARQAARLAAGPLPEAVAEHAALSLFNVLATAVGAASMRLTAAKKKKLAARTAPMPRAAI